MDYGRLSWRGIIDVEADRVALRDDQGTPHDIRDLFVNVDDIGTVREVLTNICGGFTHTQRSRGTTRTISRPPTTRYRV